MTSADWLVLAGYILLTIGLGLIYRPLAFLAAGAFCILVARPLAIAPEPKKPATTPVPPAPVLDEDFD